MLGSTEYPWLSKNSKYGQGFRLSRTYVDDGFGYGSMPDIFSQMELEPAVIQAVREKYSWLVILDECIAECHAAVVLLGIDRRICGLHRVCRCLLVDFC